MRAINPLFVHLTVAFSCLILTQCKNHPKDRYLQSNTLKTEVESFVDGSYEFMKAEYESRHNEIFSIDTLFAVSNDSFIIKLILNCLHDRGVMVPKQYYWGKKTSDSTFITHNYSLKLQLSRIQQKDTIPLLNRTFLKDEWRAIIFSELDQYGVINTPYLRKDTTQEGKLLIVAGCSISIPLTDVGKGVFIKINPDAPEKFSLTEQ